MIEVVTRIGHNVLLVAVGFVTVSMVVQLI